MGRDPIEMRPPPVPGRPGIGDDLVVAETGPELDVWNGKVRVELIGTVPPKPGERRPIQILNFAKERGIGSVDSDELELIRNFSRRQGRRSPVFEGDDVLEAAKAVTLIESGTPGFAEVDHHKSCRALKLSLRQGSPQ